MTRFRRRAVIATGGALALGAGAALATMPSGETPTPLAGGALVTPANVNVRESNGARVRIKTHGALEALMVNITLAPGGTGGWHRHAGPLITVVKQGRLTIFDARCRRHDITAGHAAVSPGITVDEDENLGSAPVSFYVTFLIPQGLTSPRIDAPAPAGCRA